MDLPTTASACFGPGRRGPAVPGHGSLRGHQQAMKSLRQVPQKALQPQFNEQFFT
jgi:hypothetical protein